MSVAPAEWLGAMELAALRRRRGFAGALAARAAAKAAIRAALLQAGLGVSHAPSPREIRVRNDGRGRPLADVPGRAATWLGDGDLGLDVSLAHEGAVGAAAALVARRAR